MTEPTQSPLWRSLHPALIELRATSMRSMGSLTYVALGRSPWIPPGMPPAGLIALGVLARECQNLPATQFKIIGTVCSGGSEALVPPLPLLIIELPMARGAFSGDPQERLALRDWVLAKALRANLDIHPSLSEALSPPQRQALGMRAPHRAEPLMKICQPLLAEAERLDLARELESKPASASFPRL